MNRRLLVTMTASVLLLAACGTGSATSSASTGSLERARAVAAATIVEGGTSIFDYPFPNGRKGEPEPASFGRSR